MGFRWLLGCASHWPREKAFCIVHPVFGNTPPESTRNYFCYPGIHKYTYKKMWKTHGFPFGQWSTLVGFHIYIYIYYIYIYIIYNMFVYRRVSCRLATGAVSFRFCGPRHGLGTEFASRTSTGAAERRCWSTLGDHPRTRKWFGTGLITQL